jgi:hypothetical protein
MYTRTYAADLVASIWYTLDGPGWQDGGLLDRAQRPRPAFVAIRMLSGLLDGARYERGVVEGAVERHSFRKGDTTLTVVWTNDGSSVSVAAPENMRAVYNLRGERLAPPAELRAGFEPLIVESGP